MDTRGKSREIQGIAEGRSNSPCLSNSSAVTFPGRNECPGTHYSLVVKEKKKTVLTKCAREFEVKRKKGRRQSGKTEQELKRRRRDEKWQTC